MYNINYSQSHEQVCHLYESIQYLKRLLSYIDVNSLHSYSVSGNKKVMTNVILILRMFENVFNHTGCSTKLPLPYAELHCLQPYKPCD